jgi:hypothetical protein
VVASTGGRYIQVVAKADLTVVKCLVFREIVIIPLHMIPILHNRLTMTLPFQRVLIPVPNYSEGD